MTLLLTNARSQTNFQPTSQTRLAWASWTTGRRTNGATRPFPQANLCPRQGKGRLGVGGGGGDEAGGGGGGNQWNCSRCKTGIEAAVFPSGAILSIGLPHLLNSLMNATHFHQRRLTTKAACCTEKRNGCMCVCGGGGGLSFFHCALRPPKP